MYIFSFVETFLLIFIFLLFVLKGLPSWGIAWYINGILVPELHLKRGVSYTFRVAGGTDTSMPSKYHPLYFTDSIEGGYERVCDVCTFG